MCCTSYISMSFWHIFPDNGCMNEWVGNLGRKLRGQVIGVGMGAVGLCGLWRVVVWLERSSGLMTQWKTWKVMHSNPSTAPYSTARCTPLLFVFFLATSLVCFWIICRSVLYIFYSLTLYSYYQCCKLWNGREIER